MSIKRNNPKLDFAAILARVKASKEAVPTPVPLPPAAAAPVPVPDTIKPTALAIKAEIATQQATPVPTPQQQEEMQEEVQEIISGMHGEIITYNERQNDFISLVKTGKNVVLVGPAGTGKTTCSTGGMKALLDSGKIPVLNSDGHKHLVSGAPGIIILSYTRRAVNNIKKVQSEELKAGCVTAHKALEFAPVFYEIEDPETGELKNTMRFEPSRNSMNPLPTTIHTIVVEESSMLGTDLFRQLLDALQHNVQWVFIGDIQQLPPVFGPAILGFAMLKLPVVELTEVYRQALESPIIRLAHRILSGKPIPAEEYKEWHVPNQLTIHPWKKRISPDSANLTLAAFFKAATDKGLYDPEEDMILIPYNKACGTLELNKHIANYLAKGRNAITYEVIAGFIKCYFSEGDKILYDKEDAEIIEITANPGYTGARFQPSSINLDYWGHNPKLKEESHQRSDMLDDNVDFLLEQVAASEDRVKQSSHKIVIRLVDSGTELSLTTAGEINNLLHAYALTVHKAQGSEWRKVFCCFHQSHSTMLQRELLYTAVTRAREELYVICEPETFSKGISSQRIKGDTLEEKAEFFKGKKLDPEAELMIKQSLNRV